MQGKAKEQALESALFRLYEQWAELPVPSGYKYPYRAELFRQAITPGCEQYQGGVQAVKEFLKRGTLGAKRLKNYPHLTLEHLVLNGDWDELLDENSRKLAQTRLQALQS